MGDLDFKLGPKLTVTESKTAHLISIGMWGGADFKEWGCVMPVGNCPDALETVITHLSCVSVGRE